MAINENANYISDLIGVGSDAMTNMFQATFSKLDGLDSTNEFLYRVRLKDFKAPTFTQKTAPKKFLTSSVDMPVAEFSGDKTLQLTFRLDDNYNLYSWLLSLRNLYSNPNTGKAYTSINGSSSFTLTIDALMVPYSNGAFSPLYKYENCYVTNITTPKYTYANSSALEVTATIVFWKFTEV